MNLLIFEFAAATGLQDPALTVEGLAMLKGLIDDLKASSADYLVSENSSIKSDILNLTENGSCNPINIKENLALWLDKNIKNYDACLPLAPEDSFILYELTQKIEEHGVKVIGSTSKGVLACSDKYETYNLLKNENFPVINTDKVFFSDLKSYKPVFNEKKMLVKPADGVSCLGVHLVRSYSDFIKASARLKRLTLLPYFLLQEFVEGQSTSVSLLSTGKTAIPLSLNLQNVQIYDDKIYYNGGTVPFEHKLSTNVKDMSKMVVESIKGLKGYVGVDLILGDEAYIVEINPRVTTSYVVLRNLLNFNLGEAIVESVGGKLPSKVVLNGSISFIKENNHLTVKRESLS